MGQSVIRKFADKSKGHKGFPPTHAKQASTDVFANGLGLVRLGDEYEKHCNSGCHKGKALSSSTVFVNGRPVHRRGDKTDCDDTAIAGSPNVFAG
tara:strand:+ start:2996 stop:3280 length:285 start_codon:yes stop_codon:yes gene_type:complete